MQADHKALQREHAELLQKYAQLQSDYQQLRHDYETLLESSQTLLAERERLQERVAELEAANSKLTNMLWGRRSERREEPGQPYNFFHWTLTHDPTAVGRHLKDFSGTLVGDAFDGNAQIAGQTEGRIRFAACNAHARREFIESEKQEPILSSQAISFFRHLYAIEERGRLLTPSNRLELRQQESLPVWGRMKAWCDQLPRERMLPKSPFGKAVTYLTNQWTALQVYLSDGRIPIDNIASERTLRPWTIGKKNWLFLGHPEAAERRLQL